MKHPQPPKVIPNTITIKTSKKDFIFIFHPFHTLIRVYPQDGYTPKNKNTTFSPVLELVPLSLEPVQLSLEPVQLSLEPVPLVLPPLLELVLVAQPTGRNPLMKNLQKM
jgi:hypothetical protein